MIDVTQRVKRVDGSLKGGGWGVLIYVKDSWVPYVAQCPQATRKTPVCKSNNRKMFVMCIYTKPHKGQTFISYFPRIIFNLHEGMRSGIWILGDFNLKMLLRYDKDVIRMNIFLKETSLCQLMQEPTVESQIEEERA